VTSEEWVTLTQLRKVVLVEDPGGDWEGLYIDGKLAVDGHTLSASYVLHHLASSGAIEFDRFDCDQDWLYGNGRLPLNLEEVIPNDDLKESSES
jgi:hypothetical protein